MDVPVGRDEVRAVEEALGVRFPADYVEFLLTVGGREWATSETFLRLYNLRELMDRHAVTRDLLADRLPGVVFIGDDGSREGLAFDFRADASPLVLLDITAASWGDALFQAPDLTTFLERFPTTGFDFETPYE